MNYNYLTKKKGIKEILLIGLVLLSIHFTEFKIGVVKLSEIILLLLPPFFYTRKINRWPFYFYILFLVWLLITLITNPLRELPELYGLSQLKKPYIISIGRFLELMACVNLVSIIHYYCKGKTYDEVISLIKKIVVLSFLLAMYNALIYFLVAKGIRSDSNLVYITTSNYFRLKGWFIEGGPYGLMLSFIFVLSFFYKSRYNFLIRIVLVLNIIFLAKSKAGMLLLVIWGVLFYYDAIYRKIRSLSIIALLVGGLIATFSLMKLAEVYIEHIENMETYVDQRPNDTNLTMGRIAGSHIVPKMVIDNPFFGIGLGNYPIERNVENYRSFIPNTPKGKTDAHGLGGIVQILVDGGIVMLFSFLLILYLVIRNTIGLKNGLEIYFLVFLCFFLAGVQIYFLYPWFLFGILISLNEKTYEKRQLSSRH